MVCLGALTSIADAVQQRPEIKAGIERIVWYNKGIHPTSGTNYEIDKKSADTILNSDIRLDVVSNKNGSAIDFTEELLKSIAAVQTPYAQKIFESHSADDVFKKIQSRHLKVWDDLVAVYLNDPQLFDTDAFEAYPKHRLCKFSETGNIKQEIVEKLSNNDGDMGIVFQALPDGARFYHDDVNEYRKRIIETHGREEWRITVLTNEFHDHLGIYSIIGAKMGLRAREYFKVGLDEFLVNSYAGKTPPVSCLNNGLQVSTGATLGHGTIAIAKNLPAKPRAAFTFKNRVIALQLKQEYWDIVKKDIRQGIEQYGLLTDAYWAFVRKLAIRYWLEWNRNEIFEIEIIK